MADSNPTSVSVKVSPLAVLNAIALVASQLQAQGYFDASGNLVLPTDPEKYAVLVETLEGDLKKVVSVPVKVDKIVQALPEIVALFE